MSSINFKKRPLSSLPPAKRGGVRIGFDTNGNPVLKDENGVQSEPFSFVGSPATFLAQSADPAVVPNAIRLYSKLVTGVAEPFVRKSDGSVIQLGAGGGGGGAGQGSWFDGGASELVAINYTSAPSAEVYQTSLPYPILGAEQAVTVQLIYELAEDGSGGHASGYHRFFFFNPLPPSGPADISAEVFDNSSLATGALESFIVGFGVDASNNLNFSLQYPPGEVHGSIQVSISPGSILGIPLGG